MADMELKKYKFIRGLSNRIQTRVNASYIPTLNDVSDVSVKDELDCKRLDEKVRNNRSRLENDLAVSGTLNPGERFHLMKKSCRPPPRIARGNTFPMCKLV